MRSPAIDSGSRYLVRNRLWRACLRVSDAYLSLLHRRRDPPAVPPRIDRVLLCVGGHLGDAVLASKAIGELHAALPHAHIGVLTGSWNRPVIENDPRVARVHMVDHWKLNRSGGSFAQRWRHHRTTRLRAVSELRAIGYDIAIDLYAYYPNASRILAEAAIPLRVGYTSGGFGPLYTHALPWVPGRTIAEEHRVVLERLIPHPRWNSHTNYELPAPSGADRERVRARLRALGVHDRYALLHMGSGLTHKEWSLESWIGVARGMVDAGLHVVLTGTGDREADHIRRVRNAIPQVVDLANALDWSEFRCVIADAAVVVSVDTVALHLAAGSGVPTVAITSGIEPQGRWAVASEQLTVLTHAVPCAPCFRSGGCAAMTCVHGVDSAMVLHSVRRMLPTA